VRFAALANRFGRTWRHAIIAMDGNTACRERLDSTLDVTFPAVALNKGDTLGNLRRCRRALMDLRPDVLVTYNWGAIEWAMANLLVRTRHIHVEDGFGPEERARQLPRRILTRHLVLRRATVAVPSRTLERIALDVWHLPPGRVHFIANGIDVSRFRPGHGGGEVPVIGTVAALRGEKNLARLLEAFALLRQPARLVIVGDGPERAGLEALALELGIAGSVRFTGHLAAPQDAFRNFDLFALSSDTEQMPLSVLEAMASGLAVAATDVGDVATMLAAENRPFVVARDAAALAEAMAGLLADPARRGAIGVANRARAAHDYDQETMFQAYAALFGGVPAI
jgi:glycosyltransferase involved in cell wall biosynthesis